MDSAPNYHLPAELLIQIFEFYLEKSPTTHIRRLLLVCRQWNEIVDQSPRLWTTVQINLTDFINYLDVCTRKSDPFPLKITFSLKKPPGLNRPALSDRVNHDHIRLRDQHSQAISNGLTAFLAFTSSSHVRRWKSLAITWPDCIMTDDRSDYLASIIRRATMLETLSIGNASEIWSPETPLCYSKRLRTLRIRGSTHLNITPLPSLVELVLYPYGDWYWDSFIERQGANWLSNFPSLRTLSVGCEEHFWDHSEATQPTYVASSITSLTLHGSLPQCLLFTLNTPNVKHITFSLCVSRSILDHTFKWPYPPTNADVTLKCLPITRKGHAIESTTMKDYSRLITKWTTATTVDVCPCMVPPPDARSTKRRSRYCGALNGEEKQMTRVNLLPA